MQQTINLFTHLDQHHEPRFSALQGLIATGTLAVCMLLFSAALKLNTNIQQSALLDLQSQKDSLQQELAVLKANASKANSGNLIARLRSEIEAKRSLLASVGDSGAGGFSEYMAGFGRQHVSGLWLEKVTVGNKGEQIAISGAMQKPSLLPRYLQRLGNENVFKGLRFQLVKIEEQPQKKQQMRFEVAVVTEADDATQGRES
ncbi:MAG: hypothetical protein KJP25_05590 [Gammaproteobacteria bacterium]|nr:hypothetical protein [Gammaproteobacteria bacterium]NND39971.1 hypothetical protein [Pseudomonadales bacterium]MBT8151337.1 hypothetical protein [Gammaproteobacteria bacterium]NNL11594.1 hypothetical protein [Pseudomonadales bacterium]NNM11000.1 hypothetical protein [Pseudomonadales bacterium]